MTQHYNISDVLRYNEGEITQNYDISNVLRYKEPQDEVHINHEDNVIFNIGQINNRTINSAPIQHEVVHHSSDLNISSLNKVDSMPKLAESNLKKDLDIGSNDIPLPSVFQSSKRHTDVSPEDLSERWFISLNTTKETLKRTTQRFLRSTLLPLARRYRADRMYEAKRLTGT